MPVSSPSVKPAEPGEVSGNGTVTALKDGDRLTREEFERRYDAMPDLKKAELIEGVVHVPSPVRQRDHGRPHVHLNFWLAAYEGSTPGVEAGNNSSVRLSIDSMPQPDCLLFIQTAFGGQVRIDKDGYIEGAPDLVAEVSASTASFDRAKKLDVYRKNGVREYLIWLVLERRIEWFVRADDRFEPLGPTADGILQSAVFPGLWLDPAALVRGDVNAVLATVQEGLRSVEHANFLARLKRLSSPA